MDIGLFLDVDNTLTVGFIQQRFASLLGVENEYTVIEREFQANRITSPQFGEKIIQLFNGAGFDQEFAEDQYSFVQQAVWADDLLNLPVTKYLVSSGPSYYVHRLADQYGLSRNNVLCSDYKFGSNGKLTLCKAVSADQKRNFVDHRSARHFLTVGVGDNPTHDWPFISACDIPIFTVRTPGALHAESLETVINLVYRLSRRQGAIPRVKPLLFIGSSSEQMHIAESLHAHLDRDCDPKIWKDGIFEPSKTNIESLEASLPNFDFAAFVLAPEDITSSRGIAKATVRDNVIFELGMFIGRLGRERCFMLHPRDILINLPTDLSGIVLLDYPADRATKDPKAAMTACAASMRARILELGCRGLRL